MCEVLSQTVVCYNLDNLCDYSMCECLILTPFHTPLSEVSIGSRRRLTKVADLTG